MPLAAVRVASGNREPKAPWFTSGLRRGSWWRVGLTSHHTLGDVGSPNLDRLAASLSERLNADEGRDEALLRSDAMSAVPRPV